MEKCNTMGDNPKPEKRKLHHIINVGDGVNFLSSKFPFWGVSAGGGNRTYIEKWINSGDILWFCKEIEDEFKMIGMGEYTHSFDSKDEPLIQLNMVERENQNWDERVVNDIQIHYKNLYITEKQSIRIRKCETEISIYDIARRINSNDIDLFKHYDGFKFYGEPK